jgi:beta-galactosidase
MLALLMACIAINATAQVAPRERISINAGWHFNKGEPEEISAQLDYDMRPDVTQIADGKNADAQPQQAEKTSQPTHAVLKPWILPTANAFVADSTKRHQRPDGNPGSDVAFVQNNFDDGNWQNINMPHDWAIAAPFIIDGPYGGMGRLPSWGVGWYRKQLDIPAGDVRRRIFLDIDGAMSYATVWLNGHLVGGWPYGYNGWRVDLTPHVNFGGVNQLAIRLDNPSDSARWYPGGGLYRNVWLVKTDAVHVAQWGTRIATPQVSESLASITLDAVIDNDSNDDANVVVASDIFALNANGEKIDDAVAHIAPTTLHITANASATASGSTVIAKPRLWGPPPTQQPHRYIAITTVLRNGRIIDQYETPFGIRHIRFDANIGLLINGEHVPIRGVNLHHDLGALGAAFNLRAAERQLQMLREMGANAIRASHNPPVPEWLDLADRMGFVVVDEIFDAWQRKKTPLDFHLIFPDWHEADLRAMLRRDRNHPSIMLWSIGNEVGEQYTGEEGAMIARELVGIAHEEDPTRPTTTAMNYAKPDMPLPAQVDVIGLNYQGEGIRQEPEFEGTERIRTPPQYDAYHARFPGKAIISTETASTLSTRGAYLFPVTENNSAPVREGNGGDAASRQVSAYDLYAVDFGASPDKVFAALDTHPFVAGEFVWTGFDYLGEPTPYYQSRSSYSGIIDLAGFPKDRYWLYQSRWRDDLPMAHLLPHWTWPGREGQITPVHVFTSGDEAELFVNGVSQGRKKKAPLEYRLRWDNVIYTPGQLRVRAYKNGKPWANDAVQTAGAAATLQLNADRDTIRNDGNDLSFITVRILDQHGQLVPNANPRLHFSIEGPGEIVATDNGDATDMTPFNSHERAAFNGLGLVIVRALPGHVGTIVLRAQSDSLQEGNATLHVRELMPAERF